MYPVKKVIRPITPEEVRNGKYIPEFVIETINKLIAAHFSSSSGIAVINQEDLLEELTEDRTPNITYNRETIRKNGWLNIETLYESYGWKIEYIPSDHRGTYPPTYTFTAKQ